MNHWKETAEILARLADLAASGQRAALATVVRVAGSAYRHPGAKLLVEEGGATLGSVSGGCLEADVREIARSVLAGAEPRLRRYDTADGDAVFGLGLGCNGQVEVFIQPATEGPLASLAPGMRERFAGDESFALATVIADASPAELGAMLLVAPGSARQGTLGEPDLDRLAVERARGLLTGGRPGVHAAGGRQLFLEVMPPPPHLLVCGAGDDARPLVAYAADAGFRVTVADHRPALLDAAWFPAAARLLLARPEEPDLALPPAGRTLAVIKTHSLGHDREWARRLLAAGLPYVGLLGPRARSEDLLRAIGAGPGAAERARVFGPVGLDLGADGPRQVALSIVAELLAFVSGREPRHLCERREAIHAV
jgi:xanthine dehydrogenase accessory factor